ncbi:aspartyl protease family protein [Shewanella sp. 1_MG-2023]|uniref:aspartyl protease family protein n=1 Tax=unclassified Shewanella TaxID=196818 RepID=UPI0026E376B3|nr:MULTISPECIES: aspartyl protease family protein [unclassified Shewanella]MDO6611311.1 aspartyl protease family protein [Shewanella sp. 7_MG-2023]MDO6771166.1 aspartyl protease family protein [Shewanella sp. 2_MG-2023]MDO6795847.1 aspartyl protease family protein [Shewanella sp. 1_MG-2023]
MYFFYFRCLFLLSVLVTSFNALAVSEWAKFDISNGHITLPVTINGIEGRAILDSGAQVNAINLSFINKHGFEFDKGRKINVKGVYGTETRRLFNNVEVNLFGADIELDELAGLRLGHHEVQILLGAGLLEKFIFQIDYPNSRLRIFERGSVDLASLGNIPMQIDRAKGQPIVKVSLNGQQDSWLVLDTGNSGGLFLKRSIATKFDWLEEFGSQSGVTIGANQLGVVDNFQLPEVKFGPYTLESVRVTVPAEGQKESVSGRGDVSFSKIKGKNIKGLLGYDVLKHFVLTIDYKAGNMHIGVPEDS